MFLALCAPLSFNSETENINVSFSFPQILDFLSASFKAFNFKVRYYFS